MTKKDYRTIAYALRQSRLAASCDGALDLAALNIADMLGGRSNFDRASFLAACGYFTPAQEAALKEYDND